MGSGVRREYRLAVAVLAAAFAVTGCAARTSHFAGRFVKPGEPAALFEAAGTPAQPPLQDFIRKVRTLQAQPRTKASLLPTIESSNPGLARALLLLAMYESPEAHRRVASAYLDAGVRDYAFKHFQRAVALDRCDAAAYDGMARLWRDWGMPEQALGDVYRGLRCDPRSAALYNTLGTILQRAGQAANARTAYARAVELEPNAAYALNNLCYLDLTGRRVASAVAFCERALALDPALAVARNNLALARSLDGDTEAAERLLANGRLAPTSAYNLGVLQFVDGRYAAAAQAFDKAADEAPGLAWLARHRAVEARRAAMAAAPAGGGEGQ
jgi:Flp pilus assembly protein TadD